MAQMFANLDGAVARSPRRDPALVRNVMRRVRASNTSPEVALRKALWRSGRRFRISSSLVGKPDIVFTRARVAVFVDGDFWHGRQWAARGFASLEAQMSRVNGGDYWISKLSRNVARDLAVNAALRESGWRVLRFWESEIKSDVEAVAQAVQRELDRPSP